MQVASSKHLVSPCSSPENDVPRFVQPTTQYLVAGFSTPTSHHARQDFREEDAISHFIKSTTEPRSPKRSNICGFSPLPPIIASPICTPESSISCQTEFPASPPPSNYTASQMSGCLLFPTPTPTWIATPPTPPSKTLRRSSTVSARPTNFTPFISSASFPALMNTHAFVRGGLKRSASAPSFSSRSLAYSHAPDYVDAYLPRVHRSDVSTTSFDSVSLSLGDSGPVRTEKSTYCIKGFHLSNSRTSTDIVDKAPCARSPTYPPEAPSPEDSWSDHSGSDASELERSRDAHRRFHALKELLATEAGYLMDLKALVTVYLRHLPSLALRPPMTSSTFGRASASFTSGPWLHSYTQLQAAATTSSVTLPEVECPSSPSFLQSKEVHRPNLRYLFTDNEIESITRNAEEILQLHQHFMTELRMALAPFGYSLDQPIDDDVSRHLPNLDDAIRAVSTKFATEASRFNAYQSFCAGHPEALDIVRKVMQQYPLEFDTFEHKCATIVSDWEAEAISSAAESATEVIRRKSSNQNNALIVEDRKRAMSLTSLDGAVRSLRPRPSIVGLKDSTTPTSEQKRDRALRRIAFMDYLIKPIQRICKYPLLLDQLLPSKNLRGIIDHTQTLTDVDVVAESAAQAMRHVAASVDEARHRQDIAVQSSLISARMNLLLLASSTLSLSLTPPFLASLGTCVLAGSLDVINHHPTRSLAHTTSIKAKYLGAFLYNGGYLILVKVTKGKKYEPRHWFPLSEFELSDVEDESATLPCSFKLTSTEQHFEFAAACKREKDVWLSSIRDSLMQPSNWLNEPIPSYRSDAKGDVLRGSDDGHSDAHVSNALPTIRSIPEVGHGSDTDFSESFFASLRVNPKTRRHDAPSTPRQEIPPPPSRRSSSTSVKAIFSPMSSDVETFVIRRSSQAARHQVDQELQDVISRSCLTARSYAFSHEEELFQAPKNGFSRSNSTMSMAGMARLSKHESVRIPRRRTTEKLDYYATISSSSPTSAPPVTSRKNVKRLRLTSIKHFDQAKSSTSQTPSPSPTKGSFHGSSASSSNSSMPSLLLPPSLGSNENTPNKPRSFVRNVKGLFHFRPLSPGSPFPDNPTHANPSHTAPSHSGHLTPNTQRWMWDSHRHRLRGGHDVESGREDAGFDDLQMPYSISSARELTPLST